MSQDTVGSHPESSVTPAAFVSYSRRDRLRVVPLVREAEEQGREFWIDAEDIPPAAEWRAELATAIETADAVVCFMSPAWVASEECRREFDRAVELRKRLIPVRIAPVQGAPAQLAVLQWIDATGEGQDASVVEAILAAIDVDLDSVRQHTHWLSRALRWDAAGRDHSLLLRGKDLQTAEEWLARPGLDPPATPLHTRLIVESRKGERRRLRRIVAAAGVAVSVALALALVAFIQERVAVHERDQAQSRALAAAANSNLTVAPELSLLLSRAAWSKAPTVQALSALRASIPASLVRVSVRAQPAVVSAATWAAGGRAVITAGRDGTISAWNASTGASLGRIRLDSHPIASIAVAGTSGAGVAVTSDGRVDTWTLGSVSHRLRLGRVLEREGVRAVAMSDDGHTVAAGMADGRVLAWTVDRAAPHLVRWESSGSPVTSLALSATGRTLLVGTADGIARAGAPMASRSTRLVRYRHRVSFVELSANGSLALTEAEDGTASLRRAGDGSLRLKLAHAFLISLDRGGRRVANVDIDGRVTLTSVATGHSHELAGLGRRGEDLEFSRAGDLLVLAGYDGTTRVWRVADTTMVASIPGGSTPATVAAASPDGARVLTGQLDGWMHVWALPPRPQRIWLGLLGGPGVRVPATGVSFSPDGKALATVSEDGLARLWSASTGRELLAGDHCRRPPLGPACLGERTSAYQGLFLTDVAYSPDGRSLATAGEGGSVAVWAVRTATLISLASLGSEVDRIAFSPSGRQIVATSRDGHARVIDARSGAIEADLFRSNAPISVAAFTDDSHVVTAGPDGTVSVWTVAPRTVRTLTRVSGDVVALAVDHRTRFVAVAVAHQVVVLDARDGSLRSTLSDSGPATALAFAPDGRFLATGSDAGIVRVWDPVSGDLVTSLRAPGGGISAIAVDAGTRRIAVATPKSEAFILTCDVCADGPTLARLAAANSTRSLTPEERRRYAA